MAATYVKGTVLFSTTGNSVSGTVASTAGNALVCGSCNDTTTNPTVTGGGITTWTKDTNGQYSSNSASSISSGPNSSGGSNTLTATASGATAGVVAITHEWSGLPSSGTLADAASPAIATGSSAAPATNSLTNTGADAVFVAFTSNVTGANPATFTSGGSGWTQPADAKQTNGSVSDAAAMAYKVASSVAAQSESWTADNSNWGALIAAYKVSAAAVDQMSVNAPVAKQSHRPAPFRPGLAR